MRSSYTQLYLHLIWATWDRLPLLSPAIETRVYAAITAKCRELKCVPLAVGGVEDHVHLLVKFPPTVEIARLVKEIKGSSSHLITHEITPGEFFKWQGAYGAFTCRRDDALTLVEYIERQKEHHQFGKIRKEWEQSAAETKETKGD